MRFAKWKVVLNSLFAQQALRTTLHLAFWIWCRKAWGSSRQRAEHNRKSSQTGFGAQLFYRDLYV